MCGNIVVSVIGSSKTSNENYELSKAVGRALIDNGYIVQCGGLGGIMQGVFEGAKASDNYKFGHTIAIVPSYERISANKFADIIIPTGLDIMRNGIVVNSNAVIVIEGGAGTLSEMAIAWSLFKLIIAFQTSGGWAEKLSSQRIDNRNRYPNIPEDCVFGVSSVHEMLETLNKYVSHYNRQYKGIHWNG